MHAHDIALPLVGSADGLLFLSGFATSLTVRKGHLVARTGSGRLAREGHFSRGARSRIRRVVIFGKGGYVSIEALAWLHGIGASLLCLDRSGQILAASGHPGPDQPALRRAQASATDTGSGLDVARYLIERKITGQVDVLEQLDAPAQTSSLVASMLERVRVAKHVRGVISAEARAAFAYWTTWEPVGITFAKVDMPHLPEHWLTVGDRHSPLSASPRLATTPVGAILNYLYALVEFESRLALLAIGLDPGMGWFHRDAPYRASAALDLMEAIRPIADAHVLDLLRTRTFARKEFFELPNGQVKIVNSFARMLTTSSMAAWEGAIGPVAEDVAQIVASSATSAVRVRTRLTQADRKRGRAKRVLGSATPRKLPSACRSCGEVLDTPGRAYCDACLPEVQATRTRSLSGAGKSKLAAMRASKDDPARTPEAKRKQSVKLRAHAAAIRAWEEVNGREVDVARYMSEILPLIRQMTVAGLMRATGLSQYYCWRVRKGDRRLHPRFWDEILRLS